MSGFTCFVWTEGQFVLNCKNMRFQKYPNSFKGRALVNVLRKVSKTKYCYIAEVHCQTIVSRESRVRGEKTNKKNIQNKTKMKDFNNILTG